MRSKAAGGVPRRGGRSAMYEVTLPFGRHRGKRPAEVPTAYLAWLLANVKLSTGVRAAVRAELWSRADRPAELPPDPPPSAPRCQRCGAREARLYWQQTADGNRRVRAECRRCQNFAGWAPQTPANVAEADAAQP